MYARRITATGQHRWPNAQRWSISKRSTVSRQFINMVICQTSSPIIFLINNVFPFSILFNTFIDDLVQTLKALNVGVDIGDGEKLVHCILFYADDIIVL